MSIKGQKWEVFFASVNLPLHLTSFSVPLEQSEFSAEQCLPFYVSSKFISIFASLLTKGNSTYPTMDQFDKKEIYCVIRLLIEINKFPKSDNTIEPIVRFLLSPWKNCEKGIFWNGIEWGFSNIIQNTWKGFCSLPKKGENVFKVIFNVLI